MKKTNLLKTLFPATLLSTVAFAIPLASCNKGTEQHIKLTSEASQKLDSDNNFQANFKFSLDGSGDIEIKSTLDTQLFKIEKTQTENSIDVNIKFLSFVNDDTDYSFSLEFVNNEWTEKIENLSLKAIAQSEQSVVNQINSILTESIVKPATMSELITLLNQHQINLESLPVSTNSSQWVWDCEKNVVFVLKNDGFIKSAPAGYELNQYKVNIWKMVGSDQAKDEEYVNKDAFSSTSQFSQYLRSNETFSKSLSFCSGIDTGSYIGFNLTFNKDETLTEKQPSAIINTNKSSLIVNSELNDIEHHGNLSTLTITKLPEEGTYTEFGTIDARVILNSGGIIAETGSSINDVVITSDDVIGVKVNEDAVVGTVVVTENVGKSASEFVDDSETEIKTDTSKPKQDPSQTPRYDGGFGTKYSPYIITTKQQMFYCAADVNSATLTEASGMHFKLLSDIDLNNEEWTPIGSETNQFFGVFDGNGYTISNLKINQSCAEEVRGFGLFGYTNGKQNTSYTTWNTAWDRDNKKVIEENVSIDKYNTVIKNITLDNVDIYVSGKGYCTGALAGAAQNSYIDNCHVKSGIISGYKLVGGLFGTIGGTVCNNCSVGSNEETTETVKVTASVYNVGGIVGCGDYRTTITQGTSIAILNTTTGKNCTVQANHGEGADGYVGGFTSMFEYVNAVVIDHCANYATVRSVDAIGSGEGMAGIAGHGNHINVIANTINEGNILTVDQTKVSNAGGIIATPGSNTKLYNCLNKGRVIANATNSVSGIAAGCQDAEIPVDGEIFEIDNCVNQGYIANSLNPTYKSDICDLINGVQFTDLVFEDADEINEKISRAGKTTTKIIFKNCTVKNTTGSINLPSTISTIVSDKLLSENITINSNYNKVVVDIPNQHITVSETSSCDLYAIGDNNLVTIESTGSVKSVTVCGENSEIVNNGTVTRTIGLDGKASKATNNENAKCANIRFGFWDYYKYLVETDKTFINYGEVTGLADSTESNNNTITILSEFTINHTITIQNYGTIKYQNNGLTTPANLMSTQNDTTLVFECYENSQIVTDKDNFFKASPNRPLNALLKWKTGYSLEVEGSSKTFDDIKTEYTGENISITTQQM